MDQLFDWLAGLFGMKKPAVLCPNCESERVEQVSKEIADTRFTEIVGGGLGSGGGVQIQQEYRVRYHCLNCDQDWHTTLTETN